MDPEHRTAGTSALGIVAQVSVLVAFWVVLWGSITPGTVLTGILLSVLLLRGGAAHPVPVRPVRILRLLWTLVIEVGLANIAMARAVFRGPERSHSSCATYMARDCPIDMRSARTISQGSPSCSPR